MADVVHLHVGAPKTGTTYLQDRLLANREQLAAHGVSYPVGADADMFRPALDLIDRRWGGQRDLARGEWDGLVGRVRRATGAVVVSHEILAAATRDQASRAVKELDAEVHVVYSARDIARQVPAEWQESVKHRYPKSFRRFLERVQSADRQDPAMWFWRVQGLPDVLTRWTSEVPPDRVHLVTVPPSGTGPGTLWRRYCTAFGIDPAWAPDTGAARRNASLGIDETALVRELNRRLTKAGLDADSYRTLVRHVVVHETLARRPRMRAVTLPPHAWSWAQDVADEWTAWVEEAGIHVVGDLGDLQPARPEGGWRNADKAKPRRVTDAALDALVAVILESATHGEVVPTETRLGRAARKLRGQ